MKKKIQDNLFYCRMIFFINSMEEIRNILAHIKCMGYCLGLAQILRVALKGKNAWWNENKKIFFHIS